MCMLCVQVHVLHMVISDQTLPESVVWNFSPYRFRKLCHTIALPQSFRWVDDSNSSDSCDQKVKRSQRICPTYAGQLHIQMKGEYGESAFTSAFQVPLGQWCQISVMIQGATVSGHEFTRALAYLQVVNKAVILTLSQATASMLCMDEEQRTFHSTEHT